MQTLPNLLVSLRSVIRNPASAGERAAAMAIEWAITTGRLRDSAEEMVLGLTRDGLDDLLTEMASWRVAMDQMVHRINGRPWEVTA